MRDLDADVAGVRDERAQSGCEIDYVRDVGKDIIGDDQVRRSVLCGDLGAGLGAEERSPRVGTPLLDRCFGDIGGRLYAEASDAPSHRVLEQIAVVARDLDDEGVALEAEPVNRSNSRTRRAWVHPGIAVRGEVGVMTEDFVGREVGGQLYEQALRADSHVQWVEGLALVELIATQVALAWRRHAEVDERVGQRSTAESAARCAHWRSRRSSSSCPVLIRSWTRSSRTNLGPSKSSRVNRTLRHVASEFADAVRTVQAG